MRSSAKLALGLLAVPLNSLIAEAFRTGEVETAVSSISETNEFTILKFEALCSECQAMPYSSLPFELKVHKSHAACDATGIYLNGNDLLHTWDRDTRSGSGSIAVLSGDFNSPVSASWKSLCTPVPCDHPDGCMAQVLTVQVEQGGDVGFRSDIRFSITISEDRDPEIQSFCNHPWHIFQSSRVNDENDFEDCPKWKWSPDTTEAEESLKALYDGLQDLHFEALELQQRIQDQKRKIREKLAAGCPSNRNTTAWETCTTLSCKLKHSFSFIPNFFRQIRYRLGPLPYSPPDSLCAQHPIRNLTTLFNTTMNATTLYETQYSRHMSATDLKTHLISLPTLLILSLILATPIIITLLICHKSTCCLRRRVDRAARREERRARAAYKDAARRLRWRQLLESWGIPLSGSQNTSNSAHLHDLSRESEDIEPPGGTPTRARARYYPQSQPLGDSGEPSASTTNILDTEIWNFRQALEYVGDLIRVPNPDLESGYSLPGTDGGERNSSRRDANRTGRSRAASSTAGLSTVVSLRTVTMSLPDTDTDMDIEGTLSESCVTLDTLHSETPPPSYHP
ncbi:hypothetical protein BJY01DRAFT_130424 [Aspergillus pseudoustus]|uniref:Uncharacterized protein n=1 Tax=Aspergillus pseudoustus TaxID=1810923 RepID=A0ABR4KEA2_9EURO